LKISSKHFYCDLFIIQNKATEHVGVDQVTATRVLMLIAVIEVFVRPPAGWLWSKNFARKIGLLGISGIFHGCLGLLNIIAGLFVSTEPQFLLYSIILPVGTGP